MLAHLPPAPGSPDAEYVALYIRAFFGLRKNKPEIRKVNLCTGKYKQKRGVVSEKTGDRSESKGKKIF